MESKLKLYWTIIDKERKSIEITLPDGNVREGTAWETSPMDIALAISKGLAEKVVVAKVRTCRIRLFPLNKVSIACHLSGRRRALGSRTAASGFLQAATTGL